MGKGPAEQPAGEQQPIEAQQAAQGPEQIDRALAVAQGGQGQARTAEQGQQAQYEQRQAGAVAVMLQGVEQAIAARQPEGAGLNALGKVTTGRTGVAIGFAVIQALALGFAQADGLAEPESFERAGAGWGAGGIAHARAHGRESSTEDNRCRCVVGTGLYRAAARRAVAG